MADKTVQGKARYFESAELEAIFRDLEKIEPATAPGTGENDSVIVGRAIKARDIYRAYLDRAAKLSHDLLITRQNLDRHGHSLSLQQLAAMTQRLSAENKQFRDGFSHGESQFQSYRLIEKAVKELEDVVNYWRVANRFRKFSRGSARERAEDDELLRVKLQSAINAIDELEIILATRKALEKDLADE